MKLIQANIWGARLEPQVIKFIKDEQPDILCLQEAMGLEGGEGFLFASVEEIQAAMGAEYAFMSPVFTINYMTRKADFGNCIISKYPFSSTEAVFIGKEYIAEFESLEHSPNMRNLQHVVIQLPDGSEVNVLNHHGHHIHQHKNGDDETMRQCGLIADKIQQLEGKIILTGDFNLAPHSESLEQINALLTNQSIEAGLTTTRTNLTHKTEVCDYIFTSPEVNVESFTASDAVISDHKALIMQFS